MPAAQLPFSRKEYDRRIAKVRKAMEAKGIDVLFVEDPASGSVVQALAVDAVPGS